MNMIPYFKPVQSNDCVYSVDKIFLMINLRRDFCDKLMNDISVLSKIIPGINLSEPCLKDRQYKYLSLRSYTDNFGNANVLSLRLMKNEINHETECLLVFNPNKLFENIKFITDLKNILNVSCCYWIVSMDIAIDLPYPKYMTALIKDRRKKMEFHAGKFSSTEYLGMDRKSIGHVKLYDKTKESKLPYQKTRLEITVGNPLDAKWIEEIQKRFPRVAIRADSIHYDIQDNMCINDTERVLIELLMYSPKKLDLWNRLGRKMKKKIEPFVFQNETIFQYDYDAVSNAAMNSIEMLTSIANTIVENNKIIVIQ